MTHNPWQKLSSKLIYSNPWIRVREDQVIRPDGKPGIYGVIETQIATGVVALTPEREIYLVGQFRYATDEYSWEIIEGATEQNEPPLKAAQRELREEAGLVARSWSQLGGEIHLSNCISAEVGYLYLAQDLEEVGAMPEATEILELRKLPFTEALEMMERGEIKDAMTIMGLLRAERWLR